MPKAFDRMVDKIRTSMKGKKNPRTNKPYTDSDIYAIATAAWKKAHGGKAPARGERLQDWRVLEFCVPIKETTSVGNEFFIKGMAINETTTRNGIKYIAKELENAAPSFRNKPILLDHKNEVKNIVGRTTENVNFSQDRHGIEFEGKIMDKEIQQMINDGRIQEVSIGASVKDLVESEDGASKTAIGLEGMEISLVAVPGDPGAGLAMAMDNSFQIRESMRMAEDFIDDLDLDKEFDENETNGTGGEKLETEKADIRVEKVKEKVKIKQSVIKLNIKL